MSDKSEINFKWLGEEIPCPNEEQFNKNDNYYSVCSIRNKKYEIGSGAIILINSVPCITVIHFLYEVKSDSNNEKYKAAVEVFYRASDINKRLSRPVNLDLDFEVVKKDEFELIHIPVSAIKSRCVLVYGLENEDPVDLFQEFIQKTQDIIYVCRFIAKLKNNEFHLKEAVCSMIKKEVNDKSIVISDSDSESKFSVARVENSNSNIKITLKKKGYSSEKIKSPSELLSQLKLSDSKMFKDKEAVVVLDNIDMNRTNINKRQSTRLQNKTNDCSYSTPSRTSARTTKKCYLEFYKSPEQALNVSSSRLKRPKSAVEITPKKQLRLQSNQMTPTVETPKYSTVSCDTPMSRARLGLSAQKIPTCLSCREMEYKNVYNFVARRLTDQSGGCMYISGVPGTGKTMTVCRVMNDLSTLYRDFVFLKLNAMSLTEPKQIYVEIAKKLFNRRMHWSEAYKNIEKFFKSKPKKAPHVLLVDELDKLCNRKQDVVYNLFDLPFYSLTPLIVITIANTMDLPERVLTNKVNSRLGLVRLTFKPYQYKDLVQIVTDRLATNAVFKNEALELIARKVASVSGDTRRALAMCSRATEIAEQQNKDLVTMDIVDIVVKEMSCSKKVQAIQGCSKLEQMILSAVANEVSRTGNEEVPFLNMMCSLEKLSLLESFKLPVAEICLQACHNLGNFRLLITQHGKNDINMVLMLNVGMDDVHFTLKK